jgi:hypothetical protein
VALRRAALRPGVRVAIVEGGEGTRDDLAGSSVVAIASRRRDVPAG